MAASSKKSALFVCLGNICRSPIAEAIFAHMVKEKGLSEKWTVDSAATSGWEIGSPPDSRGQKLLKSKAIPFSHIARQVTKDDFRTFDFIFGMDEENMSDLKSLSPNDATAKLILLGTYDPEKQRIIEDPYYGGDAGFETVYKQCTRCCKAFLEEQS